MLFDLDFLHLAEWDEVKEKYTGRHLMVEITYILGADCAASPVAINKPYVVMGIAY